MTSIPSETPVQPCPPMPAIKPPKNPDRLQTVQPVLEKLFELYPQLFGAQFLPLKLGVFQELLARHPEQFQRDTLKAALGVHTRSSPYLQNIAAGRQRHDLEGEPVEPVAPEHVYLALLELFRRRQGRSKIDFRPSFRLQLMAAFESSGLTPQEYLSRVQTKDMEANTMLSEVLEEHAQKLAKMEALRRAFSSSGKTAAEFAAMYGLSERDVNAALTVTD